MMRRPHQMSWNSRVSCCSLLECPFYMFAVNLNIRTCSIVHDCPERHLLLVDCNGLVCKLWYPFVGMNCDVLAVIKALLMHYLLLWHGLNSTPVQCLSDVTTCNSYALFVIQRRINYWDNHQGLDLGVQGHILLVFNE